jgi:hypothetical protein
MWPLGTLKSVSMLRDSSTSNVAFAGDTTSSLVLLQGGKETQIPGGENPYFVEVVERFPNRNFTASSESLCRVLSDIVMEENHTIASLRRRGNIFSEVFYELLGIARYLWVHQQHTRRPPEGGGQHFA